MNILAVAAHPDDVEFLCAGTLLKYKAQGHKIYIALTTSGNTGSNTVATGISLAAIREAETLAAAKLLDAQVRFLRFEDERLLDTAQSRRAVLTAIRWANPDIIFTSPQCDGSTDHAHTGKLVADCLMIVGGKLHPADLPPIDKHPSLFYWDVDAGLGAQTRYKTPFDVTVDEAFSQRPGAHRNGRFVPKAYVDISAVMPQKLAMLRCHKSQFAWMETFATDLVESCEALARMRGTQMGCQYAEGFVGHRLQGYMADYRLLP